MVQLEPFMQTKKLSTCGDVTESVSIMKKKTPCMLASLSDSPPKGKRMVKSKRLSDRPATDRA